MINIIYKQILLTIVYTGFLLVVSSALFAKEAPEKTLHPEAITFITSQCADH